MRATLVLALFAAACGGGAPDATQEELGVAKCRPNARCKVSGPDQYCADLSSDADNCGSCGASCRSGEVCLGGACTVPCADGLVSCRDADPAYCADVASSEADCGACGIVCAADQFCDSGDCVPACETGLVNCGTPDARACADLQADGENCGSCGRACPAQYACVEGGCTLICFAPESRCQGDQGPYCADLQTSAQDCGTCGNGCADGRACSGGTCVAICDDPLVLCGTECANVQTDPLNCGACGSACGTGYSCEAGACRLQCAAGEIHCGETEDQYCASPNDPSNCGGCGNVCPSDQSCTDGACICNSPLSNCGTSCVDLTVDTSNCGGCGTVCSAFEPVCDEGQCAADPAATSYPAAISFTDALARSYTFLTFQAGSSPTYWSSAGGANTVNLGSYDGATLASTGKYTTSYDHRAVFTAGGSGGAVYARYAGSPYILQMIAPGVFQFLVSLNGAAMGYDGSVAMTADGTEFVTLNQGAVFLWNAAGGKFKQQFALQGFGAVVGETSAPQNTRVAVAGDKLLTYAYGVLSIWDRTGVRLRSVQLVGAGQLQASHFSLTYANGYVWVIDGPGGKWRGYRVGGL